MREGWLLDIYPDGNDMVLWVTRGGSARSFRIHYPPYFYVSASEGRLDALRGGMEEEEVSISTGYELKRTRIRDYERRRVLRVEVESGRFNYLIPRIQSLEERGYRFFNVDVPRAQGFLYERDLFPMGRVSFSSLGSDIESLDDRFSTDYVPPPLKEVRMDVQPKTSINAAVESIRFEGEEEFELDGGNEGERILDAVGALDELDPDVVYLTGRDLSQISRRAAARGISSELRFGRDKTRALSRGRGKSYFSYGTVYYKQPYSPFFGRMRIDPENSFMYEDSGMEGLVELARLTKIPLQKSSTTSPGTGISSMQIDQAYRDGLLIPWRKQEPEEFKSALQLLECDRGGFIFEPGKGFYTGIGEIDFASMYPSIMERHNISPETVLCDCCDGADAPSVPECGYHICTRRRGLIPKVIAPLLERRAYYKEQVRRGVEGAPGYDMRQKAIKWLLVTCFGYLGYKNARFGRVEAHEAVTAFGRDKLFKSARAAEEAGYEVLHGIVDSLWLKRGGATEDDYEELCERIEGVTGLRISLEGIYRWIVFLPSKMDPQVPVLNRYFGTFEDGEIKARGIELRRSDTPGIVKRAQLEMLNALSEARDLEEYVERIGRCVSIIRRYSRWIREGDVDVEDLIISRRASKAPWEYSNLSSIAVSSLKLHRTGKTVKPGQFIGYVVTDSSSPDPWERVEPVEFYEEGSRYDADKYIDDVIRAGATLFEGLGYGYEFMRSLVTDGSRQRTLA